MALIERSYAPGAKVIVTYWTQPSIQATVIESEDRAGWLKVEQQHPELGPVQFLAHVNFVHDA